jgi:DNA-binding FrmR family transcriptional regulator
MKESEGYGDKKQDISRRLKRIEGQVKGIQKMLEEDKSCTDILTQIAAVRAAVNKVGGMVLEGYSKTCIQNAVSAEDRERVLKDLLDTVNRFLKFVD